MPKVLGLFDAMTGLVVEAMAFSLYVREGAKAWLLHRLLRAGDLLVGDRDFCSYAHLALLSAGGIFGMFRVGHGQIVSFRPHRRHYKRGGAGRRRDAAGNVAGRGASGCGVWAGTTRLCGGSNRGPLTARRG